MKASDILGLGRLHFSGIRKIQEGFTWPPSDMAHTSTLQNLLKRFIKEYFKDFVSSRAASNAATALPDCRRRS
jgi:hypothetical protein